MGKYYTNSYGKIYSDLAYRLGVIAEQYDSLQIEDKYKYESTLYICVLQTLLTQFNEIKNEVEKRGADFNIEAIWNEDWSYWKIDTTTLSSSKDSPLNIKYVLENLRHILSHPNPIHNTCSYESNNENDKIIEYKFFRVNHGDAFSMEMPTSSLKSLVEKLSDYLSKVAGKSVEVQELKEKVKARL
jgi:hypothetical protein